MSSPRTTSEASAALVASRPTRTLVVVVPPIIALTLGVIRSSHVPLWRDEWATALHASLTAADLVRSLAGGDAVQGPYYLLIGLLSPMIGLEEGMRIPSLLAFAATAAIVAALVMRWWGPWAGAAAGVFFSLNGAALTAGTTARPYALMVLCVALAIFAADRAGAGRRWVWAGYATAAVLAVALHLISIVALVCIGVLALGRPRWWLGRWIAWSVPALVVALTLALAGSGQRDQIAWLPAPGIRAGVSALAQTAGVSAYRAVLWDALGLIVLVVAAITALLAVGPVGAAASARATRLRPVLFAVALCFGAPAVLFLLSWITTPVYTARYLSWVSIGSALIVGAAVFTVTVRRRVLSALAGVCAVILLAVAGWVTAQQLAEPPGLYDDAPSLVRELDAGAEVGDALAVIQRNPHSGVAYSIARNIGSDTWAADVADRLRQSAQPVVEVRSITGTGPLSVASAPPTGSRDDEMSIWVISLDPPSNAELARISTELGCRADATGVDPTLFGGMRLYELRCP